MSAMAFYCISNTLPKNHIKTGSILDTSCLLCLVDNPSNSKIQIKIDNDIAFKIRQIQ